jgi:hypothetical protein
MFHNGLNRFINHSAIPFALDEEVGYAAILLAEWVTGINSPEEMAGSGRKKLTLQRLFPTI